MPTSEHQSGSSGRKSAHRLVDWLWNTVHISVGAFVLVIISILFTLAVWKIDANQIQQIAVVDHGVCKVISGANKGIGQTRKRIQVAIQHDQELSKADMQAAEAVRLLKGVVPPSSQATLVRSWHVLARIDAQSASDLQTELKSVRPIRLPGCPS